MYFMFSQLTHKNQCKLYVFFLSAGTQDRVVLIQGAAEGLMKVQNTIIEKVYEFPVPKDLAAIIGDRPKQVN